MSLCTAAAMIAGSTMGSFFAGTVEAAPEALPLASICPCLTSARGTSDIDALGVGPDAVESSPSITVISTAAFSTAADVCIDGFTYLGCCTPSSQKANISDGLSRCLVGLPLGSAFRKACSVDVLEGRVRVGRGATVAAEATVAASYKYNIINFNQ